MDSHWQSGFSQTARSLLPLQEIPADRGHRFRVLRAWESAWSKKTDRKSTRLNSSHPSTSYAVFCLKKERVGTLISGKWKVDSILGVGGMAAVYGAVHTHTQRRAAIKVLHPEYLHVDDIRGRFALEARAANRVNHRGAVAVLDDGVLDDGAPYLFFLLMRRAPRSTLFPYTTLFR